jgi:outer membrane protein OmpA-like peptidoglycan-associated protein
MRTLVVSVFLLVPVAASADTGVEAGLSVGGHLFSSNSELGGADEIDQAVVESSFALGGRLGLLLGSRFALEAEAMVIPTKSELSGDSATVIGFRGQARVNLLTGKFRPFLVLGYGGFSLSTSAKELESDLDPSIHWGAGFALALTGSIDLRLDFRHLIVPDRTQTGATSDFEGAAGVAFRFGGSSAKGKVPSGTKKRVEVAENPPPPRPTAGDSDGDGIDDEQDQCPNQAEDRDGFQDDDGCTDLDNDGDGIVDSADQCPDEPETKNGFQDDDGCADQTSTDLVGFTFPRNSDKFDPASAALLERAYQVLDRNRRLTVEIAGHTAEGEAKPLELSIARAEAVKEYLVRRGIAEDRLRTVGYGSDRPNATNATREGRDKNRRIEFRVVRPDE